MGRPKGSKNRKSDDERESRAAEGRSQDARSTESREAFTDDSESALFIPREEWPEDMTYRWVRIEAEGARDNKNWSQMSRVGWRPVPRDRHADRFPFVALPGQPDPMETVIMYGGLMLCERPTRLVIQDRQRQQQRTQDAQNSISDYVEGGNSIIPRFNQSGPVEYARQNAAFKE